MEGPRHWQYYSSNPRRPGANGLNYVFLTQKFNKIILICFTCFLYFIKLLQVQIFLIIIKNKAKKNNLVEPVGFHSTICLKMHFFALGRQNWRAETKDLQRK